MRRLEPVLRRALRGPCAPPPAGTILVAVSGGADSTALLVTLAGLATSMEFRLHAAHLHHGLRGTEADADLGAIRALCDRLGVPLTASRWDCRARMRRLGLTGQAGLRILRRRFLIAAARRAGAGRIATAHTADDQLETLLMRLTRGTSLAGIGGMSARRGRWIKPLLGATRADIEAGLRAAGIPWREDASNLDRRYTRSRMRHDVIPALLGAMDGEAGGDRGRLALRIAALTAELRAMRRLTDRLAARIVAREGRVERDGARLALGSWRSMPAPVRRAVLRRLWKRIVRGEHRARGTGTGQQGLTVRHLEALERLAAASRGAATLDLPGGFRAERDRGALVIRRPAADTALEPVAVPVRGRWARHAVHGGWVGGPGARRRIRERRAGEEIFAADGLEGQLSLRPGHPNEWFVPFGRRKARRLKEFLNKQPVSRSTRSHPLVLADTRGILWVVGVRRSARAPWRQSTRRILWVQAEHP